LKVDIKTKNVVVLFL